MKIVTETAKWVCWSGLDAIWEDAAEANCWVEDTEHIMPTRAVIPDDVLMIGVVWDLLM